MKTEEIKKLGIENVIVGAEAFGEVLFECLYRAGVRNVGFLDDNKYLGNVKSVHGVPVLGKTSLLKELKKECGVKAVYCAYGNNICRERILKWAQELGYDTPSYIHHDVDTEHAEIGKGVYVLMGSTIGADVAIRDFSILAGCVNLDQGAKIGKGVFLATGAKIGKSVDVKDFAYVLMGAEVEDEKILGSKCLIGSYSHVGIDVPDEAVAAGNPAKILLDEEIYSDDEDAPVPYPDNDPSSSSKS